MLRFRNRFKSSPSELAECRACGRSISISKQDGRETIIHELPWCERFEAAVAQVAKDPEVQLHTALVSKDETIVIADGENPADVRDVERV